MVKLERISHFAAAVVTSPIDAVHVSAALACSPLLALAAQCHQSICLCRTVFGRQKFTSDV